MDDNDNNDGDLNNTMSSRVVDNFTYMQEPTSNILSSRDIKEVYLKNPME